MAYPEQQRGEWCEIDAEAENLGDEQIVILENRLMFTGMSWAHLLRYDSSNPNKLDEGDVKTAADLLLFIYDKTKEDLSEYGRNSEQKAMTICQIVTSHHKHLNGEWE